MRTRTTRPGRLTIRLVMLALGVMHGQDAAAHRLDEYLQATRIALSAERIRIEIDLTPGIEVAPDVRRTIDVDSDGQISPTEALVYASTVVQQLALRSDGVAQSLRLERYRFPAASDLDEGTGTIHLEASAAPTVEKGSHHLSFRNSHRPDIGVYLVNMLTPSSEIAIGRQERDPFQRGIDVDFSARAGSPRPITIGLVMLSLAAVGLAARRRTTSPR